MKKALKWAGIALGAMAGLVAVALVAVYFVSQAKIQRAYATPSETIASAPDSATLDRGRHLVTSVNACIGCHGPALAGNQMIDAPVFATVAASNLTSGRGGVASRYTDSLWERAIRHGINAEGRSIAIMPASHYNRMSDDDVRAIIAYVKSVPPVDNELKPFSAGPISRALTVSGAPFFHAALIQHDAPHRAAPPAGVTPEYGEYLVAVAACRECHGPNLSGGPTPEGSKVASNLTPTGLAAYTEASFMTALREGKRPGGAPIDTVMPWREYRGMTDEELKAVWAYLRTVPPKAMGARD
ncbi:MAG TPA: c-type cytochrome [Gemmatimonadaceae bacterium]|nr:c-type cytochrome [Gemmatimonadaceae bacterium]